MRKYECVECLEKITFPVPVVADLNEDGSWGFRASCPKCGGRLQSSTQTANKEEK